jgi:sulfotransferase family protein
MTAAPLRPDPAKLHAMETATSVDVRMLEGQPWPEQILLVFRRQFLRYYIMRPPRWRAALSGALSMRRMVPTFASLGAVRSGTTVLSDYIMQHPCVVLPMAKEVGIDGLWAHTEIRGQFPLLREKERVERAYGLAVTGYCAPILPDLAMPYLLKALMADPKLVIILRNPADRAFAHWRWDSVLRSRTRNDPLWRYYPSFSEIIEIEIENVRTYGSVGNFTISGTKAGYIQHSIYLPFLKTLAKLFGREKLMFVKAEDFFADSAGVAKKVYAFLGLPDYDPIPVPVGNAGPRGVMDSGTRKRLVDFFEPLNRELYDFIGMDYDWH